MNLCEQRVCIAIEVLQAGIVSFSYNVPRHSRDEHHILFVLLVIIILNKYIRFIIYY